MNIKLTRNQRSRLHVHMNKALGVEDHDMNSQMSAFINALVWTESPGETFLLADSIGHFLTDHDHDSSDCVVNISELTGAYDRLTIVTALKIAGCYENPRSGGGVAFSTCQNPKSGLPVVTIPSDILERYIAI